MVNLLNPDLRLRDLRKLVEPHLQEVKWECGVDETSEWIMASIENQKHYQKLTSWLYSKNVEASAKAVCVDAEWFELKQIYWSEICKNTEHFFCQKDIFVIASDRSWVAEYAFRTEVFRFGCWIKVA